MPSNYTLWSCDSGAYDGTNGTITAGLPNIKGKFFIRHNQNAGTGVGSNLFAYQEHDAEAPEWSNGSSLGSHKAHISSFQIDANKASSIYGNSSTVQPPAIKVYMWRRTA